MLRRGGEPDDAGLYDGVLEAGPVRMDVERHVVSVNGEPITLPLKEFDLLEYLMRNSGRVLTRGQLEQSLYGWGDEPDSNALEVHIHHLRKKLGSELIRTVRGVGYMIDEAPR